MNSIKRETVNSNSRRIWGEFLLSDGSRTKFEMTKDNSWFQWGNTTDNLSITVDRVEELTEDWLCQ